MNTIMSMDFVVNVTVRNRPKVEQTVKIASEFALKYLRAQGVEVQTTVLGQRALTKEERIRLIPPRTHYVHDLMFGAVCGRVKSRRTSKDWRKVDCKYCLKLRPEMDQRSLF